MKGKVGRAFDLLFNRGAGAIPVRGKHLSARERLSLALRGALARRVTVNDGVMHVAQEDLPFGGVGPSGMGSYHGIDGFRRFSHAKAIFSQSRLNVAEFAGLRPPYGKKLLGSVRQQMR